MITLYNSKTRKKEAFEPLKDEVRLYTCGPTVYDYAHIGNLKTYIFEDVLKRTLLYNNYQVNHVMNITDVGHLVSDDDGGEDKVEKRAREKNMDAWELTRFYTEKFKEDVSDLNILPPDTYVKATETIEEQIELIKILEEKGFTYKISDGLYFDSSKLENYGEMANLQDIEAGKRVEIKGKKNPTDFALWKFSEEEGVRQMEWDSPWGVGFPGWHTECVVMAEKYLGIPFDIHCGGIDHIEIHHPNEIAQAEAAYGKNPARFWMHGEFLVVKDSKMSKSKGNFHTLADVKEISTALAYRYLCINAHYRSKLNFSVEALDGAENSLKKMRARVPESPPGEKISKKYEQEFLEAINDDLNTPRALEVAWKLLKDESIPDDLKKATIIDFDNLLGLDLAKKDTIPEEIVKLAKEREKMRKDGQYDEADKLRKKMEEKGYGVKDSPSGYKIIKK